MPPLSDARCPRTGPGTVALLVTSYLVNPTAAGRRMHHPRTPPSRLTSLGLTLGLALAAVILVPGTASACSCEEPPPPTEALEDADAVFLGEVVETRVVGDEFDGELIARIAVEEIWKGEVTELVDVRTQPESAMCGYHFTAGGRDLIYAQSGDADDYPTGLCTRTAPADTAQEDLAAFGEGREPAAGERLAEDGPPWLFLSLAGLAVVVAVGLAVAGLAWRRRHPSRS